VDTEHPRIPTEHIDDAISDVEALARLHEVRNRCTRPENDFEDCIGAILDTAIFVTGADKGTLQLLDPGAGVLNIRVQRGFQRPFLDLLSQSEGETAAVLGAALDTAKQVAVQDMPEAPGGWKGGDVLLAEGVRAVHSTPLTSSSKRIYGVISTHFARPTPLAERKQQLLDILARQAADYLEHKQTELVLARLADEAGTFVSECSRDLRYLFVNGSYADFLRKPVGRIVGHPIPEIIGESGFQVIRPYVDRVLAGERVEYETEIPYAGVGLRKMHVVYVPGFDLKGTVCGWIATINEIAERGDVAASCGSSRRLHMRHAWAQACRSASGGYTE
jgi:PAS domain-containing protein